MDPLKENITCQSEGDGRTIMMGEKKRKRDIMRSKSIHTVTECRFFIDIDHVVAQITQGIHCASQQKQVGR
jgi:hypothetical protein